MEFHVPQSIHMVAIRRHTRVLQFAFCLLFTTCAHGADSGLHAAVEKGDRAQVERLLTAGAAVNARTDSCETVLHSAASNGEAAMVRVRLPRTKDPRAKNREGRMPRDLAAEGDHSAIVKLLESAHQ